MKIEGITDTPEYLSLPLPTSKQGRAALEIVHKLRQAGHTAYIVGGAVRDMVMGKQPNDFDITTSALPEQVTALFEHSIPVGASFGVITVVIDSMNFEVATYREERDYMDGRRPETLRFSKTPQEDVARRDFTINALLYDPDTQEVIDFTGGLSDLRRGILRTIGKAQTRFSEDYLRMLRAVRFAIRFGFEPETETASAIHDLAHKLVYLSPERVRDELTQMLCGPTPHKAFEMLSAVGILKIILPEIEAQHGVEQPPEFHPEGDVFVHTMLLLRHIAVPNPEIGWAALLHDVGKPLCRTEKNGVVHFYGHEDLGADMTEKILHRFHHSNALIEHVTAAVRNHMRFAAVTKMRPAKWRRLIADPNFPLELELHRLDCIACHGLLSNYYWLLDRMKELQESNAVELPPPLLTGHDLILLGIKPGPQMGILLNQLRDLQLDGKLKDRQDAIAEVKVLSRKKQ